jgi:tRNA A-37 threonylcarbamoyl transferase component Bud32
MATAQEAGDMKNSNNSICPKCSCAIPADAPDGLCPKCALEGAATVWTPTSGGRRTPPPRIDEIAPHFPDLEILELLGAGGMGAVYKARQPQLDRFVALKILSHDLAGDPAFVERFNREARVLGRLSHPNIVGIHDFGTAGPYCYLTMEYVDGVNLRQAMQAGRFTPTEALAMVQHLCSALKFAHEEGILHRDIKPENILIDSKGRVKIADFGIAKLVGEDRRHDVTLTLQGSVLGSPHYMAPEQIETPGDVDQRADIYSLGVVLYEMLTGGLPIGRFALPSEKASMDARIDHIVMRTLEKERQARFQTAEEVRTEVEAVAKNPAPPLLAEEVGAPEGAGMARFSLTSAILTGFSLIATFLFFWLWIMTLGTPVEPESFAEAEKLGDSMGKGLGLAILNATIAGGTGLLGLLLGGVALGRIRRSRGALSGFGLAAFATVTWPLLITSSLGTSLLGFGLGPIELVLVTLLPLVIATIIVVRGLSRWAKGVADEDGGKRHPGPGFLIAVAAAIIILTPVLPLAWMPLSPSGNRDSHDEEMARLEELVERLGSDSQSTDGIPWRLREPEVRLPVVLNSGLKAVFQVVKHEADGTEAVVDLGEARVDPEGGSGQDIFLIKVGTVLKSDDTQGAIHEMVVVRDGPHGKTSHTGEDLRGWSFNTEQPGMLTLDCPGHHEIGLAAQRVVGEDGVPSLGSLSLKVVVTSMDD